MHACIRKYAHDIQWRTRSLYFINLPNVGQGSFYYTNAIDFVSSQSRLWNTSPLMFIEKNTYAHPHTHSKYTRVPTYNSKHTPSVCHVI